MYVPKGARLIILQVLIEHGGDNGLTAVDMLQLDNRLAEGSIYAYLSRLDKVDKYVTSRKNSVSYGRGAPLRFYKITDLGRQMAAIGAEAERIEELERLKKIEEQQAAGGAAVGSGG